MTAYFSGLISLTHKYMTAYFPGLVLDTLIKSAVVIQDRFEDTKKGNQKLWIEEGQTTQYPKEEDKWTNITQKSKDWEKRTPKNRGVGIQ